MVPLEAREWAVLLEEGGTTASKLSFNNASNNEVGRRRRSRARIKINIVIGCRCRSQVGSVGGVTFVRSAAHE